MSELKPGPEMDKAVCEILDIGDLFVRPVSTDLACVGMILEKCWELEMVVHIRRFASGLRQISLFTLDGRCWTGCADTIPSALASAVLAAREAGQI